MLHMWPVNQSMGNINGTVQSKSTWQQAQVVQPVESASPNSEVKSFGIECSDADTPFPNMQICGMVFDYEQCTITAESTYFYIFHSMVNVSLDGMRNFRYYTSTTMFYRHGNKITTQILVVN